MNTPLSRYSGSLRYAVAIFSFVIVAFTVADDFMEQTKAQCTVDGTCFMKRGRTANPPPALVRVVNRIAKGETAQLDKGSGSLVGENDEQWIVTAAHIFREGIGDVSVTTQAGVTLQAKVALRNPEFDVVLLKVQGNIDVLPTTIAKEPPKQGERTIGWGFGPNGKLLGQEGEVVGYVMTNKSQTYETLKTTGRAREGDSGGAIVNENGELIGLLWGTDGRFTYSTYAGRLRKIVAELQPSRDPPRKPEPRRNESPQTPLISRPRHPVAQTSLVEQGVFALGLGTPPSVLMYYLLRRLVFRTVKKRAASTKRKRAELNDDYAIQLNDLYELSGRSTAADATLGRLYDRKLCDAEQSSSGDLANYAKMLRKTVADQFVRIHSNNPNPTE